MPTIITEVPKQKDDKKKKIYYLCHATNKKRLWEKLLNWIIFASTMKW